MYEPYKNSKTVTHKDFGGPIFTTAIQAQKPIMYICTWFIMVSNTARGARCLPGAHCLPGFSTYLLLAQIEQVYLILVFALSFGRHVLFHCL